MVEVLGVALALLAALALAGQAVFIRLGTERGTSGDALVVVLATNVVAFVPLAAAAAYPDYGLTPRAVAAFVAAGIVGTLLGRAFFYAGIERIGASRAEPIKASMPLHSAVLAVLLLGETLTPVHLAGILLVVAGVAIISWESANSRATLDAEGLPYRSLALPLVGAFLFGVEPVFAKVGLAEGTPVLVGLSIKTVSAGLGFVAYLWWRGALPSRSQLVDGDLHWTVAAGVANTGFLLAYYTALGVAPVVLVVPIMQTSPLVVAGVSVLFLQRLEHVTPRLVAGSLVVVAGAVTVTVVG